MNTFFHHQKLLRQTVQNPPKEFSSSCSGTEFTVGSCRRDGPELPWAVFDVSDPQTRQTDPISGTNLEVRELTKLQDHTGLPWGAEGWNVPAEPAGQSLHPLTRFHQRGRALQQRFHDVLAAFPT